MYNRQIYTFIQVADCGSFSKAAEKLFISTVSVMKQINALESDIGVKLLERTNQGVFLTAAGSSIYHDAKQMIQASDSAIQRARQIAGEEQYVIRVGTSLLRPSKILIDLWSKIDGGNLPFQIKIVPFEDDMTSTVASLGKEIDCFVGPCGSIQWMKQYNVHLLGMNQCCIAVSRKHRLAKKKLLKWEDLYGETLMLVKRGEALVLDRLRDEIEAKHPEIHIIDTPNFYDADVFNKCEQMNYVMETLDIWAEVHPSLVTIPVEWDYEIPFGIVYANEPSKAFMAFIDTIKKANVLK
ncbi:DNA-binding transcriptional LysR family regulator [Neobacillus bataviensis]|uniref:DNA-binding transcriptional LysR family regulator n=1 Tax=Neobacillus bataviensis TaxID=220685 RepID=A0A561C9R8_9BACI|nr:LysR family transcriptional regulator [Neobacillus bataviensis]TWD87905.1 DNA-binding transcriptional LysR family regulator [Neobacillus bataviensis]